MVGDTRIDGTRGKDPTLTLQSSLLVTEDFERRYPSVVRRVVDVVVKEAAWEADEANRAAMFDLWSKSGYPVSAFVREYQRTPLAARVSPLLDGFLLARYREAERVSLDLRLIRTGFDVDAWIEPVYVASAVARLHLQGAWPESGADGRFAGGATTAVTASGATAVVPR
jgi:sulfonate transport system substrate-binding protein